MSEQTDTTPEWEVVKDVLPIPCDHPSCALIHKRFHEPFNDGAGARMEWVMLPSGEEREVWVKGQHEVLRTEWIVLHNGVRVGDAHNTRREALREMDRKPLI